MKYTQFGFWLATILLSTQLFAKEVDMYIQIEAEGSNAIISAKLEDNLTARDFYQSLPITVKLENYAGVEKIATLNRTLSTQNAPKRYAGKAGDLTYYAPWGNLAIFTKNSQVGEASGLIYMGKISQNLTALQQLPNHAKVTIKPSKQEEK